MAQSRRTINLPNRPAGLPFSDAVLVGDTLYISGRIGMDPVTGIVPVEADKELKILFKEFSAVLKAGGMSWDELVWVQVFSPDLSLWEQFNAEYARHFSGELPARAFLSSGPLLRNGRFEMMGIAVKKN
jgi:enamine deaminase RidA (YjgF/YER057c/UK114 family)